MKAQVLVASAVVVSIVVVSLALLRGSDRWAARVERHEAGTTLRFYAGERLVYTVSDAMGRLASLVGTTLAPGNVPEPVIERFYDGTVLPGRWKLAIDSVELDVMPDRLEIGAMEYRPGSVVDPFPKR
jgi:hypothetical protein